MLNGSREGTIVTAPDKPGGVLDRLGRFSVTGVFLAAVAYVIVALFAPGVIGGVLLALLAAGLLALLARTWPVQAPQTRAARLVMLALLVAIAVVKIL